MKLALFTDCPAVLTVISLCPPAVENTTVWLPVQRGFLAAGAAGLVWADGIVEPQVYPGDQVARHIYIVVFQENDLTPELASTSEPVDLLPQRFTSLLPTQSLPPHH